MSRQFPRVSLQSQTWKDISALLGKLPARRKRLVGFVLLASFFQGILDLLLIAFLARFVGLFSGAKLADRLPGIWVFGGGILDQTGWLLALLIASFWLTSFVRFFVSLVVSSFVRLIVCLSSCLCIYLFICFLFKILIVLFFFHNFKK